MGILAYPETGAGHTRMEELVARGQVKDAVLQIGIAADGVAGPLVGMILIRQARVMAVGMAMPDGESAGREVRIIVVDAHASRMRAANQILIRVHMGAAGAQPVGLAILVSRRKRIWLLPRDIHIVLEQLAAGPQGRVHGEFARGRGGPEDI